MPKTLLFGKESREKLLIGINLLADAVQVTLGPKGRHVVIARNWTSPSVTKDGVTVSDAVDLIDPIENMGAELVREVAAKTASSAGDGTTTATILAREIVVLGMKAIEKGANPVELKRGMDAAVQLVVGYIAGKAIPVGENFKDIENIAAVSANNDHEIGKLIAEAMAAVSKNGIITVEVSKTVNTYVHTVTGLHFDRGYLAACFVNKPEEMMSEYNDPFILICEDKMTNIQTIIPLFEKIMHTTRPVLVIADDYEGTALDAFILNRVRNSLPICCIKAPGFGDRRVAMLEDVAIATGGQVIGSKRPITFKTAELNHLGQGTKFVVDHENTIIMGGMGKQEEIAGRIKMIETQIANTDSEYEKDKNKERLAKLSGGVAVINVGANSEVEMKEKKDRVDDALGATKAAVLEGIIPGGGVALARAAVKLGVDLNQTQFAALNDRDKGKFILATALLKPLQVIAANAGHDGQKVLKVVLKNDLFEFGFNAATEEYENLMEAGVMDPAKVTRVALEHAVSVAGMILTTECVISPDEKEKNTAAKDFDRNSSFSGLG